MRCSHEITQVKGADPHRIYAFFRLEVCTAPWTSLVQLHLPLGFVLTLPRVCAMFTKRVQSLFDAVQWISADRAVLMFHLLWHACHLLLTGTFHKMLILVSL
ncbi:hypothetical protein ALPO108162_01010 [Alicyclobacillus pomorum]